jgi:alpha-galactosidase
MTGVVYEEGWQSWSPAGVYPANGTSPRPRDELQHLMGWRPGKALPEHGFEGEGLLATATPGEPAHAWVAADARGEIPSIHPAPGGATADGPVVELTAGTLEEVLCAVGERLSPGHPRTIGPGWSTWSAYFGAVTAADVVENVAEAQRLGLPFETIQIDDGYQAEIGDWLETSRRFGSLDTALDAVHRAGFRAGLWTAPFLVGERSRLAREHPDWLRPGISAGFNWGQRLHALDVSNPEAASHLEGVYRALRERGIGFHKLDFLYAGALGGVQAYREGLRLIRRGAGDDAVLLGCGAPLLPSIGLVDAMRVGPDVIGEGVAVEAAGPGLRKAAAVTRARAWTNGRLWVADPDHLVVRPGIAERERWAAHVTAYGGLVFSSDRLADLDERGLALTREALAYSET